MIIYRPHRGSLDEAMSEAKAFSNEQEMKEYIVKQWDNYFSVDDIVIVDNDIGDDDRINWKNVKHICTKRFGEQDNIKLYGCPQCIGWCSTEFMK
jgi:hypothetical protein